MLMFTSCGWFFSDVSGIETMQNLCYAARAIELAAPFSPLDLEAVLLEDLTRAQSNLDMHRNGRQLWERRVRPSRMTPEDAVARLLVDGLLGRELGPQLRYRWSLAPEPVRHDADFLVAGVRATSEVTGEVRHFAGACRRHGPFGFLAGIGPWPSPEVLSSFAAEAEAALAPGSPQLTAWSGRYAARLIRLRQFLADERHAVLREFLSGTEAALAAEMARLSERALPAAEAMADAGMPLPGWVKAMLEAHWSHRFCDAVEALAGEANPAAYASLLDLGDRARHLGLNLDLSAASASFGRTLLGRLEAIADAADADPWQDLLELFRSDRVWGSPCRSIRCKTACSACAEYSSPPGGGTRRCPRPPLRGRFRHPVGGKPPQLLYGRDPGTPQAPGRAHRRRSGVLAMRRAGHAERRLATIELRRLNWS